MTLTEVDTKTKLRSRIAKLKTRIAGESSELQATVYELRDQFTPGKIAHQVVSSFLNTDRSNDALKNQLTGLAWQLPLRLLTNVLVRDPRAAFLIKNVAPVAMHYAPQIWERASASFPNRANFYNMLRKRVIKLRARVRDVEEDASWFI